MIARQLALEMVSVSKEFRLRSELESLSATGDRGILEQSIAEAKASGHATTETLEKLVDKKLEQVRAKPVITYDVIIPLSFNLFHAGLFSSELQVSLQGNKITIGPLSSLAPQGLNKVQDPSRRKGPLDGMIAAISLKAQARDAYFAAQEAWRLADVVASAIEFCYSWREIMRLPPMPIGGVRLQNCAIVMENKKLVDTYGRLASIDDTPIGLGLRFENVWSQVKALESRLRESERMAPKQVMSTILEALRIYGAAANELDPNFAVLRFWIGLEKMMGLGQDIREAAVATRLKNAFRNKPEVWDYEIERLQQQRNKMVHRAIMEATPEDAHFAKILYGFAWGLLLEYSSKFSRVEPITTSLDLANRDADTLSQVRAALDRLLGT